MGSVVPVVVAWVVAGFCLIANGAYIGMGVAWPVGDARVLLAHGASRVQIAGFGLVGVCAGFWIWHRVSARMGFGGGTGAVHARHAYGVFVVAVVITVVGVVVGNRG